MQGYHIRIVLHLKALQSTSKSSSASKDTFVPRSIFQQLPVQIPKHTTRRNALINPKHKDYRYGPVSIDWVDFENMNAAVVSGKEKGRGKRVLTHGQLFTTVYSYLHRNRCGYLCVPAANEGWVNELA